MTRSDELVRGTAFDGAVRAMAVDATSVVETLRRRQDTEPAVTAALGRTATGALLLGAMLKEAEHLVTLRIDGDGPARVLLASANGGGEVRALVGNPRPGVEQVRDGKLNVAEAVGRTGRLTVTRDLGMRQPYASTVEIESGEVGEDLAAYFATSEQIPSAVGIGVFVSSDGAVEAAGGYLVQLMGGVDEALAERLERVIAGLPHPTTMLRRGDSPEAILRRIFDDEFSIGDRFPVRFHCPCDFARAERALLLLGERELVEVGEQSRARGSVEVVCEFCGEAYSFPSRRIEELIELAAEESGRDGDGAAA